MATANPPVGQNLDLKEQIRKLNAIGIALSGEHDLNKLLGLIVKEARRFTNADGGSLYIRENDKLNFVIAQTASLDNSSGENFKSVYLPLTRESIAGYVALTGELLNLDDVYDLPEHVSYRFNKVFDNQTGYRSKSMLVVPMRDHSDSIIGVLQLINSWGETGEVVPFKKTYEELIHSLASQAAVAIRNAKLIAEIKKLFRSLVRYSAKAIDARSPHTAGHSGRVAKYSVRMAQAINAETEGRLGRMHFSPEEIEELRMAGWLHDIGKIGVRESVLEKANKLNDDRIKSIEERFEGVKRLKENEFLRDKLDLLMRDRHPEVIRKECELQKKLAALDEELAFIKKVNVPGYLPAEDLRRLNELSQKTFISTDGKERPLLTPFELENLSIVKGNLTPDEYKEIQAHVEHTLDILEKIPFTKDLENIPKHAAAHHEYLNGTGYPRGLKSDEITIQSRIMCIADIYDALSSPDRPYKKAIPLEKTLSILREEVESGKLDGDIVELFINRKLYQRPSRDDDDD